MMTTKIKGPINSGEIDFSEYPSVDGELLDRIENVLGMATQRGLDALIVYGDREHFSNLEYLTKYDPRFEEALLVLIPGCTPQLVVALEGKDYSHIIPYEVRRHVYTDFGLEGQPSDGKCIGNVLRDCGIRKGMKTGLAGWKAYADESILDVPHYIVQAISQVTGEYIVNTCNLFTDSKYGVRNTLSAKEIVQAEIMNTIASRQVYAAVRGFRPGISEAEAAHAFGIGAQPMMTYPAMSFGEKNAGMGLASSTYDTFLHEGDIVSVGIGYRMAMIHRSAFFVKNEQELAACTQGKGSAFYEQYFKLVTKWYEAVGIGQTGGDIYHAVGALRDDMGIMLNMGHQIHTNEWINSIFFEGSQQVIRSGMAIQCDIIAGAAQPFMSAHIEDGIIIADEALRAQIKEMAPQAYGRMQNRRAFMQDVLKIDVAEEILPTSDIQGMMFLYLAEHDTIVTN
ncbi:MAG: hypothetical protein VB081_03985 [Christensenella sp.]|uniref:M24 family metallopeptidase n=1 Tax=Christensenella sp. TaxID=1935934 RepID=UPI002B205CA8|nr:M24 family metallopeptidase [Christensenella sp.]MEA5002638.1 hypothetical protein [Christensenella sp.]